jgi:hypothetical protein
MTVPATIPRNGPYVGDDITTEFDYTFLAWATEDLRVIRRTEATAEEIDLVLDTDYAVTGVEAESGGTIQLLSGPLATGDSLTILSKVALKQEMDLVNNNTYDAEVMERAFDRQCRISQQLSEELNRCVKVPPGDTTDPQVYLAKDIDVAVIEAETHAVLAEGYKDSAESSAADASISATDAAGSETMAQEWAEKPEDEEITSNPGAYSSLHWASKAASYVGGSGPRFFNEEAADPSTNVNQGAVYTSDVNGSTELKIRGESNQPPLVITRDGMIGLNVQSEDLPDHSHNGGDLTDLLGHLGGTSLGSLGGLVAYADHYHGVAVFVDSKSSGTSGGAGAAGTWMTRDLNIQVFNTISGCSLSSNRITLSAGAYFIMGFAPSYVANYTVARFYDYTGGSYPGYNGPNQRAYTGSGDLQYSWAFAWQNIDSSRQYELRHYFTTSTSATGMGAPMNSGSFPEVYSIVVVLKVGEK